MFLGCARIAADLRKIGAPAFRVMAFGGDGDPHLTRDQEIALLAQNDWAYKDAGKQSAIELDAEEDGAAAEEGAAATATAGAADAGGAESKE